MSPDDAGDRMTAAGRAGLTGLKILVSGGLLFWVAQRCDLRQLLQLLRAISGGQVLGLIGLFAFAYALSVLKWRELLRSQAITVGLGALLKYFWVGNFLNTVAPGRVGGDLYRCVAVARSSTQRAVALMSVPVDRFTNLVAMVLIGLGAAIYYHRLTEDRTPILVAILLLAALMLVLAVASGRLLRLSRLGAWRRYAVIERILRQTDGLQDAVAVYFANRGLVLKILVYSLARQIGVIVTNYYVAQIIGLEVSFVYCLVFIPITAMVTLIPITIGGFGLRETSYVWFLERIGGQAEAGVALSLLVYFLTVIFSLPGAVLLAFSRRAGLQD